MNQPPDNVPPEVIELVSELTDGSLSAGGRDRLRELLAENPAALDWYSQWMELHSLLYLDLQHSSETVITPHLTPSLTLAHQSSGRSAKGPWMVGAAGATFAAIAATLLVMAFSPAPTPE